MNDPREMRKALREAWLPGPMAEANTSDLSRVAHLIRDCHYAAQRAGWSGEDEMAVLAYHACTCYGRLLKAHLDTLYTQPAPPMVVVRPDQAKLQAARDALANGARVWDALAILDEMLKETSHG